MFPEGSATPGDCKPAGIESSGAWSGVPERISNRPEAFSEREQPTLTSPSSMTAPIAISSEERVKQLGDRIQQLEADMENVYAQLEHLSDALDTEQTRGRAARVGRYLLWGVILAAMATFWMMLRLRAGLN